MLNVCNLQINNPVLTYKSLFSSSDIFRMIKFRKLSWAGHTARIEEGRSLSIAYHVYRLVENRLLKKVTNYRPIGERERERERESG